MIDVVFQLIIFFMLTSHLGNLRRTEVDLPRQPGKEQSAEQEAAMIVDIGPGGRFFVESIEVDLNEIHRLARAGLGEAQGGAPFDVLIRPDRNTAAVYLDQLLLKLSQVGVTRWKLGTLAPGNGGNGEGVTDGA